MTIRSAFLCACALMLLSGASFSQSKSIEGVWKVTEVTTTGPEGKTTAATQPGLYIFTKKHYSIIYVSADTPRPIPEDINKMTADELRAMFVTQFVANAGTYEMKGGKVTLRPMVAKSPNAMRAGVWNASTVTINGNTMTLVTDSTDAGPARNPTTRKFVRVE